MNGPLPSLQSDAQFLIRGFVFSMKTYSKFLPARLASCTSQELASAAAISTILNSLVKNSYQTPSTPILGHACTKLAISRAHFPTVISNSWAAPTIKSRSAVTVSSLMKFPRRYASTTPFNPASSSHARILRQTLFSLLGGHSLLGAQLLTEIQRTFQVDLPLRAVFDYPTIAAISAEIDRVRALGKEINPTEPALNHGYHHDIRPSTS